MTQGSEGLPSVAHAPIFDRFEPWSGEVGAAWNANFLGVRTRIAFDAGMTGARAQEPRRVETSYPAFDEEYFEWIDVLEAVVGAAQVFTMIELGAGWGRWLMNAAAAARQCGGLKILLVGVEAEPTHFRWMKQHFQDNSVSTSSLHLIKAAVAAEEGPVRFHVGDPAAWYGQALDLGQPASTSRPSFVQRLRGSIERRVRPETRSIVEVRAVTLASLLDTVDLVDLIDLDIQGAEADVLESAEESLSEKVKRLHVGTHNVENEERLRQLFERLGWENLNDYPSLAESDTPWGRISFQDGVQTWLNAGLAAASPEQKGRGRRSAGLPGGNEPVGS